MARQHHRYSAEQWADLIIEQQTNAQLTIAKQQNLIDRVEKSADTQTKKVGVLQNKIA